MKSKIFSLSLILILGLSACGVSFNIPTPGTTHSDQINIPAPEAGTQPAQLKLSFGAGELNLKPGAEGLVYGTATYNIADFKPEITTTGDQVEITQGNYKFNVVPNLTNVINTWDLMLGKMPMDLEIAAGAYHANYDLGGLALTNLTVQDGASDVKMNFSAPNLAEMNVFKYETGASQVTLTGLGNANFTLMEFKSGAGNYSLDFSGSLQHNASVTVNSGLGNLTLVIPEGVPVQLTVNGALANVTVSGNWTHDGDIYTQAGSGPAWTIVVDIGAANLVVTSK